MKLITSNLTYITPDFSINLALGFPDLVILKTKT